MTVQTRFVIELQGKLKFRDTDDNGVEASISKHDKDFLSPENVKVSLHGTNVWHESDLPFSGRKARSWNQPSILHKFEGKRVRITIETID
jgi:hypothetical protein